MQQQQRSPAMSSPHPMTYDEVSMQRSRHFVMALQELKNLRPQLYSAAEYCESSYLYSDQKAVVLDNLKDYSVKALVNAVDHLGTVAFKLNELLSRQTTEIATAEARVACVAQRIRACQEYTDLQGLKQQRIMKEYPRYHKHYTLPDDVGSSMDQSQGTQAGTMYGVGPGEPKPVPSGMQIGRSLSLHLATHVESTTNKDVGKQPRTIRSASSGSATDSISTSVHNKRMENEKLVSLCQSEQATVPSSGCNTPMRRQDQILFGDSSRSLSSLLSFDDKHRNGRLAPTRSKSLFSSLLGRRKSIRIRTHAAV